jgi:hypothetical protein
MKKKTENRYFIPVLAVSDLTGVIVCSSFGLALNMMQAQFYNTDLCKAWWFFAALTTSMSIFLLLIIAAQRYITVCRPVGSQMTLMHKRLAIGVSIGPNSEFHSSTKLSLLLFSIYANKISLLLYKEFSI